MLSGFVTWWLARIAELAPTGWRVRMAGLRSGMVVEMDASGEVTAFLRRNGFTEPVTLGAAARGRKDNPVIIRPPADAILVKRHIVPTASRSDLQQLLRHEIARITPFAAEALFWRWDGRARPGDRGRTDVLLTMVPKSAIAPALDAVVAAGLKPDFIETDHGLLRATGDGETGTAPARGLVWATAALAVIALLLPFGQQIVDLHRTNAAIEALRPAVSQAEALRHHIASSDPGRDVLARELMRSGDILQILATVTRILPDDTYLTDFALREREITVGGRSASAPRLITALSSDPAVRNAAFAAPVTRVQGANDDAFSIKAGIAP
jgi:general secretion pathway protein L